MKTIATFVGGPSHGRPVPSAPDGVAALTVPATPNSKPETYYLRRYAAPVGGQNLLVWCAAGTTNEELASLINSMPEARL